jgi:hypothetical protein
VAAGQHAAAQIADTGIVARSWPVALEIRTPFEPTPFASAGHNYLMYELHLHNYASDPLNVRRIEVMSVDGANEEPIAEISGNQLDALLKPLGVDSSADHQHLGGGQSAVAFLCLAFDAATPVPGKLRDRIILDKTVAVGPVIGSHNTNLHVLGRPLTGADWLAADAPSIDSHHRISINFIGGLAQISERYATDWKIVKQGASFSGDGLDVHSYYAYGAKVLAVADGTVVEAVDGFPNNIPRTAATFKTWTTAIPVTAENGSGNHIVLDIGDGQFVFYLHLQPGSVHVKVGDHVTQGQLLAQVGASGDAREPHLHFQVTNGPNLWASEGVPYVIDEYRIKMDAEDKGDWSARTRELPMDRMIVDFGADTAKAQK